MSEIPTLANGGNAPSPAPASPPAAADPGEFGGAPAPRAAPKPGPGASYEQIRAAQDQAVAADKPPGEAPAAEAAPPAEGEPAKFKVGKFEVSEEQLGAMMERQAVEDLKRATLPPTADAYKAELPPDLKLPGNIEYKFDQSNPSLVAAKNWAHAKGLSQAEFSQVLSIYAMHEAQQEAALAERSRAEIAAVGVNAPARVDAIGRFIVGMVGEKNAAPIRATIVTAQHVDFYEAMIHKLTSQGGASFSQSHRVPADNKSIPNYENMTFEERRFAQDQQRAQDQRRR